VAQRLLRLCRGTTFAEIVSWHNAWQNEYNDTSYLHQEVFSSRKFVGWLVGLFVTFTVTSRNVKVMPLPQMFNICAKCR